MKRKWKRSQWTQTLGNILKQELQRQAITRGVSKEKRRLPPSKDLPVIF